MLSIDARSLLNYCIELSSETDVVLEAANEFIGEMLTCYPVELAKLARDRRRSQVVIRWKGCRRAYEVPAAFADEPGAAQPSAEEIRNFNIRHIPPVISHRQELILEATFSDKPMGIMAIASGKVLFMNDLMPAYCQLPEDQIIVPDTYDLFRGRDGFVPTDVDAFHERLKQDRLIQGELLAFRTNGAFGAFVGTYRYEDFGGIPVRISTYTEPFQLVS